MKIHKSHCPICRGSLCRGWMTDKQIGQVMIREKWDRVTCKRCLSRRKRSAK